LTTLQYAAYGSNLHPRRLTARTPSARLRGTAFLDEHSLHFHKQGMDGSGKCNILPGGSGIFVAVFSMAADEKPQLDEIEHVGVGYEVTTLDVPGFGECFTYVATRTHIVDDLAPYCWYHELVIAGCRYHALPDRYLAGVSSVARVRDPDRKRRRRNWELVHSMRPPR
jgi:hypothetical protein